MNSGSIEQDADVVMFLYRPEAYGIETLPDGSSTEGYAEVIIGKQRNGPIGEVPMRFIKNFAKYVNPALSYQESPKQIESATPSQSDTERDLPF